MRLRSIACAALASMLLGALVPTVASAARRHGPRHNHGLTIAATPNPIIAGEGVMIYGELTGSDPGGQTIRLYHRIAPHRYYTLIGKTTTNSDGFYEFTRIEGVVETNRSWYVRAPGLAGNVHSRTVFERVAAEVDMTASASSSDTSTPITFSGTVTPSHTGGHVYLQSEYGTTGTHWKTLKRGRIGAGSAFSIKYRFRTAGDRDVRALFRGDARNTAASSDPVTVAIQQAEVSDFTITTSAPTITYGSSATISGVLYDAGTTTPDASVSVTLWSHAIGGSFRTTGIPTETAGDGSYSFSVSPVANTVYEVRTTDTPRRDSAPLYEGVHDIVSLSASTTSAEVGQRVRFSGPVSPDKAGSAVYLERLGSDGHWHVVKVGTVTHASTYSLGWTFGHAGTAELRVRVPSDTNTLGGVSAPVTITVALPPVGDLPPAS